MTFRVGMKVVCVDAVSHGRYTPWPHTGQLHGLSRGEIYTVRRVGTYRGVDNCIWLNEISRPLDRDGTEGGYAAERFRPAVSPKQEVSFTEANPAPEDSRQRDNRRPVVEPMPVDGWRVGV